MLYISAGVDEVGRGAIAGPVVVCAVILKEQINGLKDSKKLSRKQIKEMSSIIEKKAKDYSFGLASAREIDEIGIWHSIENAIVRAIKKLKVHPDIIKMDGIVKPNIPYKCECYKKGDERIKEISAASIMAKHYRDNIMIRYHKHFNIYGWDRNVGYPTLQHKNAIKNFGYVAMHRTKFSPINKIESDILY